MGTEVTAEQKAAAAASAKSAWSALIVAVGVVASVLGGLGLMELQSPSRPPPPPAAATPAAVAPATAKAAATPHQPDDPMCAGWKRLSDAEKIVVTADNLGKVAELEDRPWDSVCLVRNLPRLVAWTDSLCQVGATDEMYALGLAGRARDFCGER